MDSLADTLRNTHLRDVPENSEHLLFRPQADSRLTPSAFDRIPRYLFRVASPKSAGTTNETWVRSELATQGQNPYTDDIFFNLNDEMRTTVARTLNLHLRWWPKRGIRDNFVSWTSSLLFAIQHIYYRHLSPDDGSSLEQIKLYLIDTDLFPKGIFLRDLDLINASWESDNHPAGKNLENLRYLRNQPENYFGEYLSQASLTIEGKCEIISAQSIFKDKRLLRLQPNFCEFHDLPFNKGKPVWVREVARLREAIWRTTDPGILSPAEMSHRLEALKEIVRNLDPSWKYPLAIYFASLIGCWSSTQDRGMAMENILRYFHSTFPHEQQVWRFSNVETNTQETMPEINEVKRLAYETYKYSTLKLALDHISTAETSIGSLRSDNVFSGNGHACAVADSNELVDHTSQSLLTRLRSVQTLCERLILGISSNAV